jgi:hypothetical protein
LNIRGKRPGEFTLLFSPGDRGIHQGGSLEGGIKTIIGTKTDFIVFLYEQVSVFSE